jgi:putative membrane protein
MRLDPRLRIGLQWLLNAVALMLLPEVIAKLHVESYTSALVTALLLGLINALIRPFLILITLPITVLSLGFFTLVINALLFWGVANLVAGVHVPDFWTAFWSALLYSLLTWLVGIALADPDDKRIRVIVGRRRD